MCMKVQSVVWGMDLIDLWACEVEGSDKDDWNLNNSLFKKHTGTEAPVDSCQTAASWVWNSVISQANIRLRLSPIILSLSLLFSLRHSW